jgi:hypothetical protein
MESAWRWTSPTRATRGGYGLSDLQRLVLEETDIPSYEDADDQDTLIETLSAARRLRTQLALETEALVVEARSRGVTWHQVAVALECSPQAAQKKYKAGLSAEGRARLDSLISRETFHAELSLRHGHSAMEFHDGTVIPALTEEETDRLVAFLDDQEELDTPSVPVARTE